ncbi:hypothetical protein ACUSIJ_03395 [Pseudochelatococcus sp. B33]
MPLADRAIRGDGGAAAVWAEARRLYEETDTPAREIAALVGAGTMRTLYRIAWRRGWRRHGWPRRPEAAVAAAAAARSAPAVGRQELVRKLERTVAREIAAIDARLRKYAGGGGQKDTQGIDHERHAKALATLARTLRELAAIDQAQTPARGGQRPDAAPAGEDDDDDFPRDADALRETLARRLAQLSRRRKAR